MHVPKIYDLNGSHRISDVCHGTLDGSKETRKDWETKFSVQLVMPLLEVSIQTLHNYTVLTAQPPLPPGMQL